MSLPIAREILKSKPIAYWPLQELSGTVAREIVSGRDGTYTGSPVLGAAAPSSVGKMVDFNGSSQYVTIPDDAVFSLATTNSLSLECVFRPNTLPAVGVIFSKGDTSNFEWEFDLLSDGNMRGIIFSLAGITRTTAASGAGRLKASSLYHVGFSVTDLVRTNLAINGSIITSTTFSESHADGTAAINIGRRVNGSYYDGRIAHCAFYNRFISNAEWQQHARALLGPLNRRGKLS